MFAEISQFSFYCTRIVPKCEKSQKIVYWLLGWKTIPAPLPLDWQMPQANILGSRRFLGRYFLAARREALGGGPEGAAARLFFAQSDSSQLLAHSVSWDMSCCVGCLNFVVTEFRLYFVGCKRIRKSPWKVVKFRLISSHTGNIQRNPGIFSSNLSSDFYNSSSIFCSI